MDEGQTKDTLHYKEIMMLVEEILLGMKQPLENALFWFLQNQLIP